MIAVLFVELALVFHDVNVSNEIVVNKLLKTIRVSCVIVRVHIFLCSNTFKIYLIRY